MTPHLTPFKVPKAQAYPALNICISILKIVSFNETIFLIFPFPVRR